MNRFVFCFFILLILVLGIQPCEAAKLKAYVPVFSVCTPEYKEELKIALQTLFLSRLNSSEIEATENEADAAIQITGSYIAFGTVYSLEAVIKTKSGDFIDRIFVQGDTQNELIPAITEMARLAHRAILNRNQPLAGKLPTETVSPPIKKTPIETAAPSIKKTLPVIVKKELPRKPEPVIIPKLPKLPELPKVPEKPWISQRIPEPMNGIAGGRSLTADGTEIFTSTDRSLRYYRKEKELQLIAEVAFGVDEKIIAIDLADLDRDGTKEVYVSLLKGALPASQVYVPDSRGLKKICDNLPYLLKSMTLEGKEKKIYAQKIDPGGNFVGDIYELVKSGEKFTAKNPMQLPLFGNLYSFNKFAGSKGKSFFIVSHPEGYLLVYSKDKKQLWKSRDKFGGRETRICPTENPGPSSPLHTACNFSPPQRLLVTSDNEIIVPRNTGLTISGPMRYYSKNSVVQLSWNGSSLQEKWRSEQSRYYLADFAYDDLSKELLLLEVEPHDDSQRDRGSRLVVQKL